MGTLTGEAQETLLGQLEMNGYEAWRVLAANARKKERGGRLSTMQSLMQPRFGDASTWKRAWLQWEREMVQHRVATGTMMPDDVKISIVRAAAPPELAAHLNVSAYSYVGNYFHMRGIIEEYWASIDVPSTAKAPGDMEIRFAQQGAPKGSGKSFKGERRRCGGRGHKAYQCTTPRSEPDTVKSLPSVPARPQGKEERRRFNCGKVGHLSASCWSTKAIAQSSPPSGDKGKGQGQSEGKGKGVWDLEQKDDDDYIDAIGAEISVVFVHGVEQKVNASVALSRLDLPARDLPSRGDCLRR